MHAYSVRDEGVQIIHRQVEHLVLAGIPSIQNLQREGRHCERFLADAVALRKICRLAWLERREPVANTHLAQHFHRGWKSAAVSMEGPECTVGFLRQSLEAITAGERRVVREHHGFAS